MTVISTTEPAEGTVAWTADDLHAWQVLRPLLDLGGYLPWSTGAMRPSGLVDLCNEIVLGRRTRIVELGSGASTTLLARLLRTRTGTLTAIEHDAAWADHVTEQLASEGLGDVASVIHAPLEPQASAGAADLPWYAAGPLAGAAGGGDIDLLIVDGPPAYAEGAGLARLPALPALADRLTPDGVVVLDDIVREGERQVLEHWERETAFRFERRSSGIAIGRRPSNG